MSWLTPLEHVPFQKWILILLAIAFLIIFICFLPYPDSSIPGAGRSTMLHFLLDEIATLGQDDEQKRVTINNRVGKRARRKHAVTSV